MWSKLNLTLLQVEICLLSQSCNNAELIRAHWQIENGLHWVKDVTLQDDDPPRRGGYAPINWAIFNLFLITVIRRLGCRTIPDGMRKLTNQVHDVFRCLT